MRISRIDVYFDYNLPVQYRQDVDWTELSKISFEFNGNNTIIQLIDWFSKLLIYQTYDKEQVLNAIKNYLEINQEDSKEQDDSKI